MSSIPVLISGLPGAMAAEVAQAVAERGGRDFFLHPVGLSSRSRSVSFSTPFGTNVQMVGLEDRDHLNLPSETFAVDFSTPAAGLDNLRWLVQRSIPTVMGTTGFDMMEARAVVEAGSVPVVIAPNMAVPIVLLQALVAEAARRFPGALRGYDLRIEESHQATKKDVSGTAKALLPGLAALGLPAALESVVSVRNTGEQKGRLGVPEQHLGGHAWHFYRAGSPDGHTRLEISHCIEGRRVYADGALTALRFLRHKWISGWQGREPLSGQIWGAGRVFSMVDVLEG